MKNILVTGATGQIGSELTPLLRENYGDNNVIATGHRRKPDTELLNSGPFHFIDCNEPESLITIIDKYSIDTIFHLASILSATAEKNPQTAWHVNINGLINVLEAARTYKCSVFVPSSIGAFGATTPPDNTPQDTIQHPNTMYGITKVTGELLCDYYFTRFGVDTRGLRFPGLISHKTLPGGGTTDYAVEIFYEAIQHRHYTCYLEKDTRLDMMYMPDALRAALMLMEADPQQLIHRNAFNVTAMSITPQELAASIQEIFPDFSITYYIDPLRQKIADSWPNHMDDTAARSEWSWQPEFKLKNMTEDMIAKLTAKLNKGGK